MAGAKIRTSFEIIAKLQRQCPFIASHDMISSLRTHLQTILLCSLICTGLNAQSVISIQEESEGRYAVDASINGVGVRAYYTPENWFASLSSTTYLFLYENGYIENSDVKGMTVIKMPDGSSTKAASFIIRNLRMGNVIVQNLPAFVIKKQSVPLLIGSATFGEFGEVIQEEDRLIINDGTKTLAAEEEEAPSLTDSLKTVAQAHIEAKEYSDAVRCLEQLKDIEGLSMSSEYQYITLLNIMERSDEVIPAANAWLGSYGGKSLTLDYWIYDSLGDSFARKKNSAQAIENYKKAVDTYCEMFSTTEKEIRKSAFKDESLGFTLYGLGQQYGAQKNLRMAEYYLSLAAKCGNPDAISFCKQYKVKF